MGISTPGESVSLERKIESSIFLCIPRDLNILGKSCTTFVIVKIVRNLSRGRSPCQRVNHVKSGVIYFSAFIFSYDTIHVSGTIHTWNRDLTEYCNNAMETLGRSDYNVGYIVLEVLRLGFDRYMAEGPGRTLTGYINLMQELQLLSRSRSAFL